MGGLGCLSGEDAIDVVEGGGEGGSLNDGVPLGVVFGDCVKGRAPRLVVGL